MQYHWLNKQDNENLIIFFCGWSFDYKPFERLDCGNNDVLCVYDYGDIGGNESPLFGISKFADSSLRNPILSLKGRGNKLYKTYSLVAWSMGVYAAYLLKDYLPEFDEKIAINGTPYPVHDEWGIPKKTFDLTLKYVDTGLQGKFQKNLFKRPEDYQKYLENPVARSIANQKQELIELDEYIKTHDCSYSQFYDRAIISDTDKIIPTRNQLNFWRDNAEITVLNSGHFPFFEFESWEDILKCKQTLKQ